MDAAPASPHALVAVGRLPVPNSGRAAAGGVAEEQAPLHVRCVTWNVGELDGEFYCTHMLIPLLLGCRREVDIVAIGLQETEMSAGSFLAAGVSYDETDKGRRWSAAFTKALAIHRFDKVASFQLMGLHLSVFVRQSLGTAITPGSVKFGNVGTGLGGMGFNKGCIALRLELGGSRWLFLNCHLAAGQSKTSARNSDWRKITSKLQFEGGEHGMESDYVFVMGDMNYRITLPGLREEELRQILEPLRCGEAVGYVPNSLLQADQLSIEKSRGKVFLGYEEEPITFCPTYKYDVNTDVFDTSPKQRTPSWCDRVLWRTHENIVPVRGSYNSYTALKGSDHKPVGLELLIFCRTPLHSTVVKAMNEERAALVPLPAAVADVPGVETIMPSSFFHIAPDGTYEPYSTSDSVLIAKARALGQPSVRIADVIQDGEVLQFEVRFGGNAWDSCVPQGTSTGMLQVSVTPTATIQDRCRKVVELPACWSGTAALSGLESKGTEWQMGSGDDEYTWPPLDESLVTSLVEFYLAGGPLYSSVLRLSAEQEVDLARSHVRRLGLHQYFHIGPNGGRSYYNQVDNTLIRAAVEFGHRSVTLDDVVVTMPDGATQTMQFEIRFGENATSPRMPTPPPSGIVQVNLATNNTRVVDKIDHGVEVLQMRQVNRQALSEQRSQRAISIAVAANLEPEPEPEPQPQPQPLLAAHQSISFGPVSLRPTDSADAESVLAQMIRAEDAKQKQAAMATIRNRALSQDVDLDDDDTPCGEDGARIYGPSAADAVAAHSASFADAVAAPTASDEAGGSAQSPNVPPRLPPHPPPLVTSTNS